MAKNESKNIFDEEDDVIKKPTGEKSLFDDQDEEDDENKKNEDDKNKQDPTGTVEIEKPIVSTIPEWARAEGVRPSKEDEREFNRPIIDLPVDRNRLNPNTAWMRA